jgi:hypothetical protein
MLSFRQERKTTELVICTHFQRHSIYPVTPRRTVETRFSHSDEPPPNYVYAFRDHALGLALDRLRRSSATHESENQVEYLEIS